MVNLNPRRLKTKKWYILLFFSWLCVCFGFSQEITVRGSVTSSDNIPLPGASVTLVGSNIGVATDFDGNYEITVTTTSQLQFSYVGYVSQIVSVNGQAQIDITLSENLNDLSEVVIVGYGTQTKKVSTAATSAVSSEDLINTYGEGPEQAMQGQIAGVTMVNNSGQPAAGMRINIRGVGTTGNSSPLFVVDGVPVADGVGHLDPNFIERIDVLKDAAASSIYGARAANGVVLITTKKGKVGKLNLALNSYYGIQDIYKKVDLLNASQYATIMNEAALNSNLSPIFTTQEINSFGKGTDWQDEAINSGAVKQNHSLTVNGGSELINYASSLSYLSNEGIIGSQNGDSKFERITFSINTEIKAIPEVLTLGENFTYARSNISGVSDEGIYNNSVRGFLNTSPIFPVYDENGEFTRSRFEDEVNPAASLFYQNMNENIGNRFVGNIYGEITLLKGLTFKTDLGVDINSGRSRSYNPYFILSNSTQNLNPSVNQSSSETFRWNFENYFRYKNSFNLHNVELLAGMTALKQENVFSGGSGQGLIFDDFDFIYLNNATDDDTYNIFGGKNDYALNSYFGRMFYDYENKYLASASFRRDGSSNFGSNNKFGNFYAFSLGWNISEENFFNTDGFINTLKVRGSWGQNGNDRIGADRYRSIISSFNKNYFFGIGEEEAEYIGSVADRIPNPDLKWETSEQLNVGLDARLFNNFTLTFDYYNKLTKDWLIQAAIPLVAGAQAPFINGGDVENKGFELELGFNKSFGELRFSINGNFAMNENEVTQINNADGIIQGEANIIFQGIDEMFRVQEGYPVGFFYGYTTNGVFQNEQEVTSYGIQPNAQPGDVRFVDINNDNVIDANDKSMIGNPNPDYTYGLNINLNYKAFDFSIYGYGMAGHENAYGIRDFSRGTNNYTTEILDRWHGEGSSNTLPRVTFTSDANGNYTRFSDLYIKDASFFRIRSVNLGFDIAQVADIPFSKLRLYLSANNLYTFTKYPGMDPEVGNGNTNQGWARGVDVGAYPQSRIYIVGLNMNF